MDTRLLLLNADSASTEHIKDEHDQRNHQKYMEKSTGGVGANRSDNPKYQKNENDCSHSRIVVTSQEI